MGILAATPTTLYQLDSNYSYYKYLGPGANDTSLTWGTPASERFSINHIAPLTNYNFSAAWNRSDAATTALQETGTAVGRGTIDTYRANGSVSRELTRLDSISWSGSASTVSYSDPTQTPYVDYTTAGSWTHRLSPTTTFVNSVNFDYTSFDNATDNQRLFWTLTSGLQSQLSKRLFFNGAVGAVLVNAYQNGPALTPLPPAGTTFQPQVGAAQDWIGNAGLSYQLLKDTRISLTAARSVSPTTFGSLQKSESIGLSLSHEVNSRSNLAFLTQFSHQISGGIGATSGSDTFTASAAYNYSLTRDWKTNLRYTYSQREDPSGLVRSNTVSFGLVYDFNLFGKPPAAVPKTQSELALEDLRRAQQALPTFSP